MCTNNENAISLQRRMTNASNRGLIIVVQVLAEYVSVSENMAKLISGPNHRHNLKPFRHMVRAGTEPYMHHITCLNVAQ